MQHILTQLATASIGSLGFALLFGLRAKHLAPAALGGMITWGIYLGVHALIPSLLDENGQFLRTPNGLGATVKRPGYSQRYAKELIKRTGSRYASQE